MSLLLFLLLSPFDTALAEADRLAAVARAALEQPGKVDAALEAYDALLKRYGKDLKLAPRLRRRKASLLKRAERPREALEEYDRIVTGRARRKDKARALYDGARLLEKAADFAGAEARLRRAMDDFGDIIRTRAKASLALGKLLESQARTKEAERAYRHVVEKCRDQAKASIAAYDALALLALKRERPREAHRWLRACTKRYEKRATRDDKYGVLVSRLLGEMRAPRALAAAASK